ncbi:hypothetical protein BGI41_07580 [Methanobrevibacter sp. 87.7]|uniref:hypothetical protein n=1 Tax=Methanobrevibacter sp. 87.7 TaxID=387957 RepID=UPI000B506F6D|nr:hypothetical protein [Methanobrevibacter sp. 87.7]OWT32457.1 hypothetical protein BGI41_07580 [Methanobrevibacter sp. 87.7]
MFGELDINDLSEIKNPKEFKSQIDTDLLQEFENYAKELGFTGISYSSINFRIKNKFPEEAKNIILLRTNLDPRFLRLKTEFYESEGLLNEFNEKIKEVYKLSDFLRKNGFFAEIVDPIELEDEIKRCAEDSKTGIIGRSKAVIFKEGPAPKIFAISTNISNLPKVRGKGLNWIIEYCMSCGKCNMHCPEKAFDHKGNLIEDKCIGFHEGCEICIEKCPFFDKDYDTIKSKYDKKMKKMSHGSIF